MPDRLPDGRRPANLTSPVRVVSVEYDDPAADIGLVEFVGEGAASAGGAWAFSLGAEEVAAPQGKRHAEGCPG